MQVSTCDLRAGLAQHPIMNWSVYIILCSDDSLYTGITTDMERRLAQHASQRGAKYFRGREPGPVVYLETGHTRSTASQREAEIKKLPPQAKRLLITSDANSLRSQALIHKELI